MKFSNLTIILALLNTPILGNQVLADDWSKTKVLKSQTTITVVGENKLIVRNWEEFVIADEPSKGFGYYGVRETDFIKMISLQATIFNASGKKIKELKKKDIRESSVSNSSVYDEHKTKYFKISYPKLPYRLQRIKVYEINSAFFWPDWDPQKSVDVERAELEIILETPVEFDYQNIGRIGEPEIFTDARGFKHYRWIAENVAAFENEYRYATEDAFQIGVKIMPKEFNLSGFRGTNETWQSFGNWYYRLIKNQLFFAPEINFFDSLSAVADIKQRVRHLYRYLQDKTRYVQIYLGVDGWRPHSVTRIHNVKYGDCKDLSVYMIALLEKVGIKAYPALVLTRDKGWVDAGFPGNSFNHVITVVPILQDTLWLECTSDVTPYNDLPESVEGVNVLLVKPDNSELIRTPISPAEANKSKLIAKAKLLFNRTLRIDGVVTYSGNRAIDARGMLKELEKTKQREWFLKSFSMKAGDAKINSFLINALSNPDTVLTIEFSLDLQYYARKAGSRLIIEPRLFHKIYFDGEKPEDRLMSLLNMSRFVDEDSVEFEIPEHLKFKISAKNDTINSQFGEYRSHIISENNKLFWKSSFVSSARDVTLEDYPEYYNYMTKVKEKAQKKVILRRK